MPSDWTSVPSVEIHQPGVSTVSQGYGSAARRSEAQPAPRGLEQAQAQVDQVITIMQDNMEKVLERDSKLTDLDYRAESLQAGAQQFEQSTGRIKRKYWWKNLKMMIILISIILIVITIIIVVIVTSVKSK